MDDQRRRAGSERRRGRDHRHAGSPAPGADARDAARRQARDGRKAARHQRRRRPRDGRRRRECRPQVDGRLPCPLAPALHEREGLCRARRAWKARDGVCAAQRYDLRPDRDAELERPVRARMVPLPAHDGRRALAVRTRPGRGLCQRLSRRAGRQGHQLLGRHPDDDRVRRQGILHVRDVVDPSQQLQQRRRQSAFDLRRDRRPRDQERALALGIYGSLPHAVLVYVRHALRQGLGLPVPNRSATSSTAWPTM